MDSTPDASEFSSITTFSLSPFGALEFQLYLSMYIEMKTMFPMGLPINPPLGQCPKVPSHSNLN